VKADPAASADVTDQGHPRWVLIVVLGALSTFGPISTDIYLPSLPSLAVDMHASTSLVQLSLTACVIGLATGQLIAGPLSDRLGRRRPLLIGLAGFIVSSLLCALAPSIGILIPLRVLQGLSGSAGLVISRAIVRDLYSGVVAARFFSRLMLVSGLAPIIAPIVGAQILRITGWRGAFLFLGVFGVVLFLAAYFGAPETRPGGRRVPRRLGSGLAGFGRLLRDRQLVGYALASGLGFATMFAYISGSSFVIQDIYGGSPQLFSMVFATNALGLVALGQVNGRMVGRIRLRVLFRTGLITNCLASLALVVGVVAGLRGMAPVLVPFFFVVASQGLIMPNGMALVMQSHPEAAGTASALVGFTQFLLGAIVAPLVGVGGSQTALPLAIVMLSVAVAALAVALLTTRHPDPPAM